MPDGMAQPAVGLKTARILCLDDDESVRLVCELALLKAGHTVDTAPDGTAGWAAMSDQKYDLVLTDNDMPGLTGLELIRKMRLANMKVPAVLMSGALSGVRMDEVSRLQWTAVLSKPFTPQQLRSCVHDILAMAGSANAVLDIDGAIPGGVHSVG
jgi:DNA-binding response OmpR family regulator